MFLNKAYNAANIIPNTIGKKLLDRLDNFKLQPDNILYLGYSMDYCLKLIQKRYPKAERFGLHHSQAHLAQVNYHQSWWRRSPLLVCGNCHTLPFLNQKFDLICANLALLWPQDLARVLLELQRIIKPEGLLLSTWLGPDSFKEFAQQPATYPSVLQDMHTIGDNLVNTKFTDVVMDVEYFNLYYRDITQFSTEMVQLAFNHLLPESASLLSISNASPHPSRISITWEVIYGQAWGGKKLHVADDAEVSIERLRRNKYTATGSAKHPKPIT